MRTAILLLLLPSAVLAQSSPLLTPLGNRTMGIELLHPFYEGSYDQYLSSGGVIFSGRLQGSGIGLLADLPVYTGTIPDVTDEPSTGIGNPYVAAQFGRALSGSSIEVGARLPLSNEVLSNEATLALQTDIDRSAAFGPKLFSAWGIAQVRSSPTRSAIQTSARVGFMHASYRGENDLTRNQVVYALTLTGRPQAMTLDLGVSGLLDLDATDRGLNAATIHQLGASLRAHLGRTLVAGTQLRIPLDDELSQDFSLAVSLEVR